MLALLALVVPLAELPARAADAGDSRVVDGEARVLGAGQRSRIAEEPATFESARLGIAFTYPRDWAAAEESSRVQLTGADGGVLVVERLDGATAGDNETDLPNTRCGSQTNGYGISVRTCFDTISRSTSAWFEVEASTGGQLSFRAWTREPAGRRALAAVAESVRSAR